MHLYFSSTIKEDILLFNKRRFIGFPFQSYTSTEDEWIFSESPQGIPEYKAYIPIWVQLRSS